MGEMGLHTEEEEQKGIKNLKMNQMKILSTMVRMKVKKDNKVRNRGKVENQLWVPFPDHRQEILYKPVLTID